MEIHNNLISLWIRQAVFFEGNFKVSNSGRSYLSVNKGKATFCDNGYLRRYNKKPEVLANILYRLVDKYQNFEHNGIRYYYSRGKWGSHVIKPEGH